MSEIARGGNTYRTGKLDALRQFHLQRKLAPIVPKLAPVMLSFFKIAQTAGRTPEEVMAHLEADPDALEPLIGAFGPFADALAAMSEADANMVIATCMAVVQRQQGEAWTSVWNVTAQAFMFQDIELDTMLPLMVRVVQENLGPFIRGLLPSLPVGATQPE